MKMGFLACKTIESTQSIWHAFHVAEAQTLHQFISYDHKYEKAFKGSKQLAREHLYHHLKKRRR